MRASLPALLLLPVALTGCPALLSDWTIGGVAEDASVDAGGHDAAGDSSTEPSGSFDASLDADASQASEDAAATDSRPEASESGSSDASQDDSGPDDSGPTDAGPCVDGGAVYLHHVGLLGLTWQDCVPTGTYDATEALAACAVYAAATDAVVDPENFYALCNLGGGQPIGNAVLNDGHTVLSDGGAASEIYWTYDAADFCPSRCATGHVAVSGQSVGGGITSAQDPSWD